MKPRISETEELVCYNGHMHEDLRVIPDNLEPEIRSIPRRSTSRNKQLFRVILGMSCLLLLIGGIYTVNVKKSERKTPSISPTTTPFFAQHLPSTAPTMKPPLGMTQLDVPDWKTYTSSLGSFTIQYPSTLRVSMNDIDDPQTHSIYKNVHFEPIYIPVDGESYAEVSSDDIRQALYVNISFRENSDHASLDDRKRKLLTSSGSGIEAKSVDQKIKNTLKDYTNGNISGIYYQSGWDYDDENIEFVTDKYMYSIMITGDSGGFLIPSSKKLVEKMLSTFRLF